MTVLFADIVGLHLAGRAARPRERQEPRRRLVRAPGRGHRRVRRPGRQDRRRRDRRPVRRADRPRGRRRAGGAGRAAHAADHRGDGAGRGAPSRRCRERRPMPPPQIRMRIGVNTGEVLVGALRAGGAITAMGDVVNTASRLQTSAQPGEVVVGGPTYAATHGVIAYEPRGMLAARGREERVEAWAAVETLLPPGYRPRRPTVPAGRAGHRARRCCATRSTRRSRNSPGAARARGRRRRPGQDPPGRRAGRLGGGRARRDRARGPLRALRRGQRLVAGGRGAAPGLLPRARPRRSTRPAPRTLDRVAQAFHLPPRRRRGRAGHQRHPPPARLRGRAAGRRPVERPRGGRRRRSCPSSRRRRPTSRSSSSCPTCTGPTPRSSS